MDRRTEASVTMKGRTPGVLALVSVLAIGLWVGREAVADEAGVPVRFELVSEVDSIRPGERFTVGLRMVHEEGWHTYWKNPGIVGVETSLEWEMPEGFSAGEIQWPPPKVVKMAQVNAYGHEGETFLLVEISAPEDLVVGGDVELRAKVTYLACATTCHPGYEDVELRLEVVEGSAGEKRDWNPRWREAFAKTRATFPRDLECWGMTACREGEKIYLALDPAGAGDGEGGEVPNLGVERAYFFSTDNQVNSDAPQELRRLEGGGLILGLTPSFYGPKDADWLEGVLYSADGWLEGGAAKAMTVKASWRPAPAE